ncbi:MAG: hypothetical protein CUR32_08820 [Flavobacterium sp.]|nr:MAG: hypothetical protein CUR32_08820 [Flavobacterium sp.] [Flavobacterium sp. FEMGT703F]
MVIETKNNKAAEIQFFIVIDFNLEESNIAFLKSSAEITAKNFESILDSVIDFSFLLLQP